MRFFTKILLVVLLLGVTLFAKSVATVTGLKGQAFLKRDSQQTILNLGDKLLEKDRIITGAKAKVQLVFEDETVITIGRNSNFSIDEYLFEDSNDVSAKFGMFGGAMRAITGKIGKIAPDKFKVKTKTATIGIRGTNFTIIESEDGSSSVYCTYGAINVSVNGVENIVKQGFYLYISVDGLISMREFNAKNLNKMRKKNFGKPKSNKSRIKEQFGYIPQSDEQIDTTREVNGVDIVVRDISDTTQDATKVNKNIHTNSSNEDEEDSNNGPSNTSGGNDTSGTNTSGSNVVRNLDGYVVGNILPNVHDYIVFGNDSSSSYIFLNTILNQANQSDSWKLHLASDFSSYSSKEEFKIAFVAAEVFNADSQSTTINPSVRSGELEATGDDLLDGDYMSWGRWNAEVSYDYTSDNERLHATHSMSGLWVMGEETPTSVIDGLNGTSDYIGIYRAMNISSNGAIVNGRANMHIDFANNTASLHLDYDSGRDFNLNIYGNKLLGYQSNNEDESGATKATFYGPDASEIGGNFQTTHYGDAELKGVYQLRVEQK